MKILRTGVVSSVGLSSQAACAAIRSGIAQFKELPYLHPSGEFIVGSPIPNAECDFEDSIRIRQILLNAVKQCLHDDRANLAPVPLIVCTAESERPGRCRDEIGELLKYFFSSGVANLDERQCTLISNGHAGVVDGLARAQELLEEQSVSTCLLCGVDSYINAESLRWLDESRRLKTSQNSDGTIPGECAAAVLLGTHDTANCEQAPAIIGFGSGFEHVGVLSDEPFRGEGLSTATRSAIAAAGLDFHEIGFRVSDMTGEAYGFKEQALVISRLMRQRRADFPIWQTSDCVGDIGAAAGLLQLAMVERGFSRDYAPGNNAICFTSSVPGNRGVFVVAAAPR